MVDRVPGVFVVESTQIVTNFRNATDSTESFHESNQGATWSMSLF